MMWKTRSIHPYFGTRAVPETETYAAGSHIGKYRILCCLGEGGMGTVFRAVCDDTGQEVALKTIRAFDRHALDGIHREVRSLARLRHRGIVAITDFGTDGGRPWYAMEWIEGITLRTYWYACQHALSPEQLIDHSPSTLAASTHAGTMPAAALATAADLEAQAIGTTWRWANEEEAAAATAAEQTATSRPALREENPIDLLVRELLPIRLLCDALVYLHEQGLVHRDLKPENVLVRPGGHPVLVDFGLASRFGGDRGGDGGWWRERVDVIDRGSGTIAYMAPEQILGELVDARADLYALGIMLYELATDRWPFEGSDSVIARGHMLGRPTPPRELNPEWPPALEALIMKLLARNKSERMGYARDVAEALADFGIGDPMKTAQPARSGYLYRPDFVGRERELALLTEPLAAVKIGIGKAIAVIGEAGTGKTRLALEAGRVARRQSFNAIACQGDGSHGAPFSGFSELFRFVGQEAQQLGSAQALRVYGPALRLFARFDAELERLFGDLPDSESTAELLAEEARDRLIHGGIDLVLATARRQPMLLIVDDVHAADEHTVALAAGLLRSPRVREAPLLFLAFLRATDAGVAASLTGESTTSRPLLLDPLELPQVEAMAASMLAQRALTDQRIRAIVGRSQGNPFLVAELLRGAVETGALVRRSGGAWSWQSDAGGPGAAEDLPLPVVVRETMAGRLRRLGQKPGAVVAALAVLGKPVPPKLVAVVSALGGDDSAEGTAELLTRRILTERGGGRLGFAHDVLWEVAYSALPEAERIRLHRRAAQCLERLPATARMRFLGDLGRHWERLGSPRKAAARYRAAGRWLAEHFAFRDAKEAFEHALRLSEEGVSRISLLLESAEDALLAACQYPEAAQWFRDAIALAKSSEAEDAEARGLRGLAQALYRLGELSPAETAARRAVALARTVAGKRDLAEALRILSNVVADRGSQKKSMALANEALALYRSAGDRRGEADLLVNKGVCYRMLGVHSRAERCLREALDIYTEIQNQRGRANAMINLATVKLDRGETAAAIELAERSRGIFGVIAYRTGEVSADGTLATAYRHAGRRDDAAACIERVLGAVRETGDRRAEATILHSKASLLNAWADAGRARAAFTEALNVATAAEETRVAAASRISLAELYPQEGSVAAARALAEAALRAFRELPDRAFEAYSLLVLARHARLAGGDLETAESGLTAAAELLGQHPAVAESVILQCERAHLAMARGADAAELGARALAAGREIGEAPGSDGDLGPTLRRLARAMAGIERGEPLFRGELRADLGAAFLAEVAPSQAAAGAPRSE